MVFCYSNIFRKASDVSRNNSIMSPLNQTDAEKNKQRQEYMAFAQENFLRRKREREEATAKLVVFPS